MIGLSCILLYGADTNIAAMMQSKLSGIDAAVKSVTKTNATNDSSNIADDGTITYFYADPNNAPAQRCGTYQVTFTLSRDGVNMEKTVVPVIIYWDAAKVKEIMTAEIADKVTLDATKPVTENLTLPKIIDGKKWTQISWQSSDNSVISINNENQQTANTLFNPYVGVVKQGATEKKVTPTATFTFQYTNDVTGNEKAITLNKTFDVIVPPIDDAKADAIKNELSEKLNEGFNQVGLTDAVTGAKPV